jgi:hypothetical protein
MQNVDLHIDATHAMHIRTLRGQVITLKGTVPALDDPTSFKIRVTAATVVLDGPGLTALMNDIVFNYKGSPVRRLRITIENGEVVQHGVMHKGVDIPFTMNAKPELQPDGTVKLAPTKMRVFGGASLVRSPCKRSSDRPTLAEQKLLLFVRNECRLRSAGGCHVSE